MKCNILERYFGVWCVVGIFVLSSHQLTQHIYSKINPFQFIFEMPEVFKILGLF